jgi:type IV secretory pathway VirB10-like protein
MQAALEPSADAPLALDDDPHASKLAADDPRLKVHRPRSRVLKMGPVIGAIALILGVGAYAVLASVRRSEGHALAAEPVKVSATPPAVPAFIERAPSTPELSPPVEPRLPAPPLPAAPALFDAPARPDPLAQQAAARQAELARAEEAARASALFFPGSERTSGATANAPPGAVAPPSMPMPAGAPGLGAPPAPSGDSWDPNLQGRKNAFLDSPTAHSDYLAAALQPALSPYEVKATTIIPATLITGINSDLPGPIIAQVRERVFDTVTGQHLLIPQGARLLASYDSMVAWGQERVLMCWNRIIFPNGSSINLACMPAADLKGQAGLTDQVDNHWDRLFAAVGLSTVLSLGTQAAAGDPTGYQPNLAQQASRNAAGQINAAGQGIIQRQLNLQPTITVRPGFGVNVIVTKDMVLEPYVD